MFVAVTGGSGKIGRYVLRELVAYGHEVVNLDRSPPAIKNPSNGVDGPYREFGYTPRFDWSESNSFPE